MSRSSRFDAATVQEAINTCEEYNGGPYANRSKLFEAVAERLSTTQSTIAGTFDREKLTCKTPLGRVVVNEVHRSRREVDPVALQAEIDRQESMRTFPHHTALWEAIAASEWGKEAKVTPSLAGSRAKEFGLRIGTKAGRVFKGRETAPEGSSPAARPRATQGDGGEERSTVSPRTPPDRSPCSDAPGDGWDAVETAIDHMADLPAAFDDPTGEWADFNPDQFFRHFLSAGLTPGDILDIGDLVTSADKTDAENERIRQAWSAVRRLVGPTPGKVGGSLAG